MNKYNPLKHWLTVLVLGPIFWILCEIFLHKYDLKGSTEAVIFFIVFGLLYSLPVFLLYILTLYLLSKKMFSPLLVKTILNVIGVIGILMTFILLNGDLALPLSLCYSFAFVISSLFYMR